MFLCNTFTTLHGLFQNRTKINITDIKALYSSVFWDVTGVSSAHYRLSSERDEEQAEN
jgi:hypothetical protein